MRSYAFHFGKFSPQQASSADLEKPFKESSFVVPCFHVENFYHAGSCFMKNIKIIFMCFVFFSVSVHASHNTMSPVQDALAQDGVKDLWRTFIKRAGFQKVVDYVNTPDEEIQGIISNSGPSSSQYNQSVLVALQAFEARNPDILKFKHMMRQEQAMVKECQEEVHKEFLRARLHAKRAALQEKNGLRF